MRNILNIIVHDFRRLTSSVVALVILMGIIVVPCLFAWFNTLSNDDPFKPQSTGRIPVAVVSEDEGTEMLGLNINVGEKFIDAVNGNDMIGWDILEDKEKAIEGVYAGDYYAAVIVPEEFSENVLSFSKGEMRHPKILFYENEKTNAIAPKITGKVREVLEEEIDRAFVDTIGSYITEAADAAKAAGLDPQDAFGDLSSTMTDLSTDLEGALVMVRGAAGLSDAAGTLLKASDDLIGSSEDTLGLAEELLESAEGRIPEKADTTNVQNLIDKITEQLSKDLDKIDSDLSSAEESVEQFNQYIHNDLKDLKELVETRKSSTDEIADNLKDMGFTGLASRFSRISGKLDHILDVMGNLEDANDSNWATMKGYIDEILSDVAFSEDSITKIEADVDDELDKKLNQVISDARQSISETRASLSGIYGDMDLLEGALDKSDKSLKSLKGGLNGTLSTLTSLQNGAKNLAALFENLSGSDMLEDVNHLMTNDAAVIAENMATPIKMNTEEVYPIRNFGSVMAPFYMVIAQWIGAMFAAVMIHVQVKRREEEPGAIKLHEAFFGRYRLFLMIGLAQALLVSVGELLYVGIQCLHPLLFILAALVNSIVFTLIVYSLVFALGNIGLAAGVIIMILQVAGGGGTFPVEVLPPVFKAMFPFMPFHYAMDAMRECIGGMYDHTYIKCLGILILFGLAAIAFGLLLHKPMRGIIETVEESKRESDVML
ncbi:MAG: YhgE/Pip domain-containing protein [Clostridiales bacterium]|nr:YhgE/Pip domain-containing protein [Clostridiales bacterium]